MRTLHSCSHRPSSFLLKVLAVLTASLTLVFGLPSTANAVSASTFSCGAGHTYTVSGAGVATNGSSCTGIVTIDSSATSIGYFAFQHANITSVIVPSSVTIIDEGGFYDTTLLTSVTLPSTITSIGANAFRNATSLASIDIPRGVTYIDTLALLDMTALTAINVDPLNTTYSSLEGVLFNKSQTQLLQYPIARATSIYAIPSTVTSVGEYAFYETSLLTVVALSPSMTSIGNNAFSGALSITSILIPVSVISIGNFAFDSTGLTSITIPTTVTSIGVGAFSWTFALTNYTYCGSASLVGTGLHGTPTPCTVPGLTPTLAIASATTSSFSVQVTNFDSNYMYIASSTAGSPAIDASGLVTVSGLNSRQSSNLTVTTTRSGYTTESATTSASAQVEPMNIINDISGFPTINIINDHLICNSGAFAKTPTGIVFSLYVNDVYVSSIASGDLIPYWLINGANKNSIIYNQILNLKNVNFDLSKYSNQIIKIETVAYSNNAIGLVNSNKILYIINAIG